MPRPKKTHHDYRMAICFFCCRKGDRTVTTGDIEFIKKNILSDFDIHKEFLPLGTCGSCRRMISSGNVSTDNDYNAIIQELTDLPRGINDRSDCICFICDLQAHNLLKT